MACDQWAVTVGCLLLTCRFSLVASARQAGGLHGVLGRCWEDPGRAPVSVQRGFRLASGGPWDSSLAPWDDPREHRGAAGIPWAIWTYVFQCFGATVRSERTFSNVLGASGALALRLCSEIVHGQVRSHPPVGFFHGVFALGGEPARRGTDGLTADT